MTQLDLGGTMELLQLEYFREVAAQGQIAAAARKLYISAPSLSATISRLEKELGTRLFDRSGNSIRLNESGKLFLRYADQALRSIDDGKAELCRHLHQEQHHIKIAATTSNLWVGLLSAFSVEYPQITLSNTSLKLAQIPENELYPRYNFLLAEKRDYTGKSLASCTLIQNDLPVIVVPPGHRLSGRSSVWLEELRGENFLLPVADMSMNRMARDLLEHAGLKDSNLYECSYMLRRRMVSEHRGIAFSTEYTSRSEDPALCYIPILRPSEPQTHAIFFDSDREPSGDEAAFIDFAREFFGASGS